MKSNNKAFSTESGNLKFKHIIHLIGPEWHGVHADKEIGQLKNCIRDMLKLCLKYEVKTIVLPEFSDIYYGFDI